MPCSYVCQRSGDQDNRRTYQNIQKHIGLGIGIADNDLERLAAFPLPESRARCALEFVGAGFAIDELPVGEFPFSLGLL
jgi:hypothetical protein